MATRSTVRVTIEVEGLRHVAEGTPDAVMEETVRFLSRVAPQYDVASKLVFMADYAQLLDELSKIVRVTTQGAIILELTGLAADRAVLLVLAGAHVAKRFGKRDAEDLMAEELARAVGKASKTISNTIGGLQKGGLVERIARGSYKITMLGLKQVQSATPQSSKEIASITEVRAEHT